MTESPIATGAASQRRRDRGFERWGALGGPAYVVLFIAGAITAFQGTPAGDAAPAEVQDYFGDSGHRDRIYIGWILVVLAVFLLLWFVASLRQSLRRLDDDGYLSGLATIGGAVYATLTLAGISVWTAISTMSDDTYRHTVYPELVHAANDAGYMLHASGGIGAGAMMIAASLVALRAHVIAAWLGWLGILAGVLALGSIFFFPQAAIALWLLVAGGLLFARGGRTTD